MYFRRRFRTWLKKIFVSNHDYIGLIYTIIEGDKCFESAVVKVPQFKLNPAASIQFQGHIFDVLVKDNIKKYKKGNIFHIDIQISSNL